MAQPLSEPAVLISENCPDCRGSGEEGMRSDCGRCEGQGRELREVPLSEFWQMVQDAQARLVAPPPSVLREQAGR